MLTKWNGKGWDEAMVDRYMKVTLTVIAFALCLLAVENFNCAAAESEPMKAMICDGGGGDGSCASVYRTALHIFE